jgi:hypothetical protein
MPDAMLTVANDVLASLRVDDDYGCGSALSK